MEKGEEEKCGRCIVCGGKVVQKIVEKFDPSSGPKIIGPGYKKQMIEISEGYHCISCGLKYEFPTIKK